MESRDKQEQYLLQSKEETNKLAFIVVIPPELVRTYKGKIVVDIPTGNGNVNISGGSIVGVDKKGNVLIGVRDDDPVWVSGVYGTKGMTGKEFGEHVGNDGKGDVPTIKPGPGCIPPYPGATEPPVWNDLKGFEPPKVSTPDVIGPEIKELGPDVIGPNIPDMGPDVIGGDIKPVVEPQFGNEIPEISYSDLMNEPNDYIQRKYFNNIKDMPTDIYNTCKKTLLRCKADDGINQMLRDRDIADNYERQLQGFKNNGMLDDGSGYEVDRMVEIER